MLLQYKLITPDIHKSILLLLTIYMTSYLPSVQAKKGDKSLHLARNLRDEWRKVIPNDDMDTLQNRITMWVTSQVRLNELRPDCSPSFIRATEMRVGLDSKTRTGFSKMFQAHAYRKYAEETYHYARVFRTLSRPPREVTNSGFSTDSLRQSQGH
jgi:hypothetical protein